MLLLDGMGIRVITGIREAASARLLEVLGSNPGFSDGAVEVRAHTVTIKCSKLPKP